MENGLGPSEIGQIAVPVHDLRTAVQFYRDILGIRFLIEVPKMAFFDCAGVRLMLAIPEVPEFDHPSSIPYFEVDDIQGACNKLSQREVKFTDQPHLVAKMPDHELWMAFFKDPDDNTHALMSEVR